MQDLDQFVVDAPTTHSRQLTLATHPYSDADHVVVHGTLIDTNFSRFFDVTGTVKEPGTIHHLDVKLLIASKPLRIEKAQATMIHVPLPQCHETLDLIAELEGLEIKSGFPGKLRSIMGGKKGCTHLCHLITVMTQEIVQGWLIHERRTPAPLPDSVEDMPNKHFLIDSCKMWTRQGPKFKALEQAIANSK